MHTELRQILVNIPELYNLCGERIRPIAAQINTDNVGHATYSVTAQESPMYLDGPGQDQPYNIEIVIYHPDISQVITAADATKQVLNGYRSEGSGATIQLMQFTGESETADQDETTSRTQTYSAWIFEAGTSFQGFPLTDSWLTPIDVSEDYTATLFDHYIFVDTTNGNVTITLPSPATPNEITIKKIDTTTNVVSITGSSSEEIDGGTVQDLASPYSSVTLVADGSVWRVV